MIITSKYNGFNFYVYKVIDKINTYQKEAYKYIGSATRRMLIDNIDPNEDCYLGSPKAKCLEEYRYRLKHNPEEFRKDILGTFNTVEEAVAYECELHIKYNVNNNPTYYNQAIQTSSGFNTAGMTMALNASTMELIGLTSTDDPRWSTGEITNYALSFINAKDSNTHESLGRVSINDPRWNTGEIIHINKDTATAVCSSTNKCIGRVSIDDPRWKSGEIVSVNVGFAAAIDSVTNESLGHVSTNDPRWKSGEICGVNSGKAAAIDSITNESLGHISTNDPRWKSGEIISISKGSRHPSFRGYYITPNGRYASRYDIISSLSIYTVSRYCKNPDTVITNKMVSVTKYFTEADIGKTVGDLGFHFELKEH
jgi:hypothetical protein